MKPTAPAVLSIGSNLGDRIAHLRSAVALLTPYAVSSVWETAPVGGVPQGSFLNAVLLCELDAERAWELAQEAERRAGRQRVQRWGPRTLDVDVVDAPPPVPVELTVPHPRAHERAFVLLPWLEVAPTAQLPDGTVADLAHRVGTAGVHRTGLELRP